MKIAAQLKLCVQKYNYHFNDTHRSKKCHGNNFYLKIEQPVNESS